MDSDKKRRNSTKLEVWDMPKVFRTVEIITATAWEKAIGRRHRSNNSQVWLSSGSSVTFLAGILLN